MARIAATMCQRVIFGPGRSGLGNPSLPGDCAARTISTNANKPNGTNRTTNTIDSIRIDT